MAFLFPHQNDFYKALKRIMALLMIFCFLFEQTGFAQLLPVSRPIAPGSTILTSDTFHPVHLRSIDFNQSARNFTVLLDTGDATGSKQPELERSVRDMMTYFFIGLRLPNTSFWVNLRPDSPDRIIDDVLARTDIGRIMLEADVQLKKDLAGYTSPRTKEGKAYWDKLYKKAEELFGNEDISIPTVTRPWIVPNEIILRDAGTNAYIYKATLKVLLESDYLKDHAAAQFEDARIKTLNDYSSQIIRETIIPKLSRDVNVSRRYAQLRQVYYSLILAQWFKQKFDPTLQEELQGHREEPKATKRSLELSGLASKIPWSKEAYFNQYRDSFQKGEYNVQATVPTPYGQTIRQYFSGGIQIGNLGAGNISVMKDTEPAISVISVSPAIKTPAIGKARTAIVTLAGADFFVTVSQSARDGGNQPLARDNAAVSVRQSPGSGQYSLSQDIIMFNLEELRELDKILTSEKKQLTDTEIAKLMNSELSTDESVSGLAGAITNKIVNNEYSLQKSQRPADRLNEIVDVLRGYDDLYPDFFGQGFMHDARKKMMQRIYSQILSNDGRRILEGLIRQAIAQGYDVDALVKKIWKVVKDDNEAMDIFEALGIEVATKLSSADIVSLGRVKQKFRKWETDKYGDKYDVFDRQEFNEFYAYVRETFKDIMSDPELSSWRLAAFLRNIAECFGRTVRKIDVQDLIDFTGANRKIFDKVAVGLFDNDEILGRLVGRVGRYSEVIELCSIFGKESVLAAIYEPTESRYLFSYILNEFGLEKFRKLGIRPDIAERYLRESPRLLRKLLSQMPERIAQLGLAGNPLNEGELMVVDMLLDNTYEILLQEDAHSVTGNTLMYIVNMFYHDDADLGTRIMAFGKRIEEAGEENKGVMLEFIKLLWFIRKQAVESGKDGNADMRQVLSRLESNQETSVFVLKRLIDSCMVAQLEEKFGRNFSSTYDDLPKYNQRSFRKAVIKLLLQSDSRLRSDMNVHYLLDIAGRHNEMSAYYRAEKSSVLEEMSTAGFDVEYLLNGREILKRSFAVTLNEADSLTERFRALSRQIVGSRDTPAVVRYAFNSDPKTLYGRINEGKNYERALQGDREALKTVLTVLLQVVQEERQKFDARSKAGKQNDEKKERILEEYDDLLNGLLGECVSGKQQVSGSTMTAVRCRKLMPETLFDNQRLSCCIFKPDGMHNQEISLLLLDPKTPLMMIWVEGHDEFMALPPQYLGWNKDHRPVVFIDTFEANNIIYEKGKDFGKKFALDAMVLDAFRMGAKEMPIYQCSYGKPQEYVDYIKNLMKKPAYEGIIREEPQYYFEGLDVEDRALSDSKGDKHHYTDAFGVNKPLKGSVPCYVIDVRAYCDAFLRDVKDGGVTAPKDDRSILTDGSSVLSTGAPSREGLSTVEADTFLPSGAPDSFDGGTADMVKGAELQERIRQVLREEAAQKNRYQEYRLLADTGAFVFGSYQGYLNDEGLSVKQFFDTVTAQREDNDDLWQRCFTEFKENIARIPRISPDAADLHLELFRDVFEGMSDAQINAFLKVGTGTREEGTLRRGAVLLNLTKGCSNQCLICGIRGEQKGVFGASMPFPVAVKIMQKLAPASPRLAPYRDSDPLDYYDDVSGATIVDIVRAADAMGYSGMSIITHGSRSPRIDAPDQIRQLAALQSITFSIHLYHRDVVAFARQYAPGLQQGRRVPAGIKERLINKYVDYYVSLISAAGPEHISEIRLLNAGSLLALLRTLPDSDQQRLGAAMPVLELVQSLQDEVWRRIVARVGSMPSEKILNGQIVWMAQAALLLKNLGVPEDIIEYVQRSAGQTENLSVTAFDPVIEADGSMVIAAAQDAETVVRTVHEVFPDHRSKEFRLFLEFVRAMARSGDDMTRHPVIEDADFKQMVLRDLQMSLNVDHDELSVDDFQVRHRYGGYLWAFLTLSVPDAKSMLASLPYGAAITDSQAQALYAALRDMPFLVNEQFYVIPGNMQYASLWAEHKIWRYRFKHLFAPVHDSAALKRNIYEPYRMYPLAWRAFSQALPPQSLPSGDPVHSEFSVQKDGGNPDPAELAGHVAKIKAALEKTTPFTYAFIGTPYQDVDAAVWAKKGWDFLLQSVDYIDDEVPFRFYCTSKGISVRLDFIASEILENAYDAIACKCDTEYLAANKIPNSNGMNGEISAEFSLEDSFLMFKVVDNGMGRNAAPTNRKKQLKDRLYLGGAGRATEKLKEIAGVIGGRFELIYEEDRTTAVFSFPAKYVGIDENGANHDHGELYTRGEYAMKFDGGAPAGNIIAMFGLNGIDRTPGITVSQRRMYDGYYVRRATFEPGYGASDNLALLKKELYAVKGVAWESIDLVYNRENRLIAVFPVLTDEMIEAYDKASLHAPRIRYLNLSYYYHVLPQVSDPFMRQKWHAIIKQLEKDMAAVYAYKNIVRPSDMWQINSEVSPYIYVEIDRRYATISSYELLTVGEYAFSPSLEILPAEPDPTKYQLVLPVFPTVYSPAAYVGHDKDYYSRLCRDFDLKPGHDALVVGPGVGIEAWLVALRTKGKIRSIGINPFEVANLMYTASLANFEVEAIVGDNIITPEGEPRFKDKQFDRIIWNMPVFRPAHDIDHIERAAGRLDGFWDGDYGGAALKRFASGLLKVLKPEGQAIVWNEQYPLPTTQSQTPDMVEEILKAGGDMEAIGASGRARLKVDAFHDLDCNSNTYIISRRENAVQAGAQPDTQNKDGGSIPRDVAGIDFSAMSVVQVPAAAGALSAPCIPGAALADKILARLGRSASAPQETDVSQEWQKITQTINSGAIPQTASLEEYIRICCQSDRMVDERDKVLVCIAEILRLEEDRDIPTDPALKELLVLLDSPA